MMKNTEPQSIQILCQGKTTVGQLIQMATAMASFNQQLSSWLEPELVSHCLISHIENGIVHLVTDSSAWATRLRFITPQLLSKIRTQPKWSGIKSIKIRISADTLATLQTIPNLKLEPFISQNLSIPTDARSHLEWLLSSEDSDSPLGKVLERILKR